MSQFLRGTVRGNATPRVPRLLVYGERHLRRILAGYAQHYNEHRPHQLREQRRPQYEIDRPVDMTARISSRQVVHGLISEYRRAG